jgi:D-alanine-D-alanine ligase-like ATP-grasp enzyme
MYEVLKKDQPVLGQIFQKIAPSIGASVHLEPEWGIIGQITFKDGYRSYFKYNSLDLNPLGSASIANDKDYSNYFMEKMGYTIVPGSKAFYSDEWAKTVGTPERNIDAAYQHALELGFPVILKPNSGKQGTGVALVHTKEEFYLAAENIFTFDRILLVQKQVQGKDYRIVVLDDEVVAAYERIPLSVVGDGVSTIFALLEEKQKNFLASSRDTHIKTDDPRIELKLRHQSLSLSSIPEKGQRIPLLDNANLSSGGDSIDVTREMHSDLKKMAIALTKDMGLRFCGVDLILQEDVTEIPKDYWILEVNASPGLDHYMHLGEQQQKVVEELYLKMLTKLSMRT